MAEASVDTTGGQSEDCEEAVDPRVQGELERLNYTSCEINKLERELDKARTKFKQLLNHCTNQLNATFKKLGKCVNKARPYHEALKQARVAQAEAQQSVLRFQRANSMYKAAKETVAIAEEKMMENPEEHRLFDSAWQEMLNHATMKFAESEREKTESEREHERCAAECAKIQLKVKLMEKDMPRSIARSRPYFDLKDKLELHLQQEKQMIEDLQRALNFTKTEYSDALRSLETISNEVHHKRKLQNVNLPPRTPGVGAESENSDLPSINLDDGASDFGSDFTGDIEDDDLSISDLNLDTRSMSSAAGSITGVKLGERPGDGDGTSITSAGELNSELSKQAIATVAIRSDDRGPGPDGRSNSSKLDLTEVPKEVHSAGDGLPVNLETTTNIAEATVEVKEKSKTL